VIAELVVSVFCECLFSKSKVFFYCWYSLDFGSSAVLSLLILYADPLWRAVMSVAWACYIVTFFDVARVHTGDDRKTFGENLLKWSVVSLPGMLAFCLCLSYRSAPELNWSGLFGAIHARILGVSGAGAGVGRRKSAPTSVSRAADTSSADAPRADILAPSVAHF
jgi:hypothetical protein